VLTFMITLHKFRYDNEDDFDYKNTHPCTFVDLPVNANYLSS
jgi:hypothetical protein